MGEADVQSPPKETERKHFWERKWCSRDRRNAAVFLVVHSLCLFAPFHFSWSHVCLAIVLTYVTACFGITLCYHRCLTHASFKLPKWLEYFFALCGVLALQGDPIEWVSNHRYHHKFVDTQKDPHSPIEGFWFSHMGWLFDKNYIVEKRGYRNNVGDLEKQGFYKMIRRTYFLYPLVFGIVLYILGGFSFIVWGIGVRLFVSYHGTFGINSVCHIWGNRAWKTDDLSRNNWFLGVFGFGEGWHNNHHAFEHSARHGLEWWQMDITWYTILLLQAIGLATDVKLPTQLHKQRLAFNTTKDA